MAREIMIILFLSLFCSSLANGDNCGLVVQKTLENGNPIPVSEQTVVQLECKDTGNIIASIWTELKSPNISIYLANEEKTILVIQFTERIIVGFHFEKPHVKQNENLMGPFITRDEEKQVMFVEVPREWLPMNTTRMSASVNHNGVIYNYYGIFNYDIGYPATMVVEEYKKLKCCLNEVTIKTR